jgi:metallo-beta-lactamase family protein
VKADIKKLESFSGHGDYKELMEFLSCQDKNALEKMFIVHGEYKTQKNYVSTLEKAGYHNIEIPARGQSFEI